MEGWEENPRTTSHIEGIERLRRMIDEARWNDIEVGPETPWSPVTAQ
jgi:hypothetical protein